MTKYLFHHFLIILCAYWADAKLSWTYGIISAQSGGEGADACMVYDKGFHDLPKTDYEATKLKLGDLMAQNLCENPGPNITDIVQGRLASTMLYENCSICDMAETVQEHGALGLLVVQNFTLEKYVCMNESEAHAAVNISVVRMLQSQYTTIQAMDDPSVQLYGPPMPKWDMALIVIWVLATGTVAVGAYWAGIVIHQVREGKRGSNQRTQEDNLEISPLVIIILVIMMCSMLVLLYFFYDYLVYIVIALFTLACSISLYGCLLPLYESVHCFGECRVPANKIPLLKKRPRVKCIILGIVCAAICITWAVMRNAPYAWVVQDILGVTFCIQMMKTIRLPSLKACTILLGLLFFYDIFFVFITPLFIKDGESIMVRVATGSGSKSGEMLPMVMKVPHADYLMRVCGDMSFSLLGFGDILVPGLLVSYNHGFDMKVGGGKIYYIASVIAYGVGMVITFIALALMETGQPALLYLVPCTLLTTVAIALCRRQLKHMWRGNKDKKKKSSDISTGTSSAPRNANQSESIAPSTNGILDPTSSIINSQVSDTSDEEATLLSTE